MGLLGELLPHVCTGLSGSLQLGFALFVPVAAVISLSTMLVVDACIRRWNGSRQFGLRDLFRITTVIAVVLSLLATEQRLAGHQTGESPFGLSWWLLLRVPAIFGLGCFVYALAWGIENAIHRLKSPRKAGRNGKTWTGTCLTGWRARRSVVVSG